MKTNSPVDLKPKNLIFSYLEDFISVNLVPIVFTLFMGWCLTISAYLKDILSLTRNEDLYPLSAESIPINIQAHVIIVLLMLVPCSLLYMILSRRPIEPAINAIDEANKNDQKEISINTINKTDNIIIIIKLPKKILG